jgi:hypothetical protein
MSKLEKFGLYMVIVGSAVLGDSNTSVLVSVAFMIVGFFLFTFGGDKKGSE